MVKTSWIYSIEANKEAEKEENRYKGWHKENMTEKKIVRYQKKKKREYSNLYFYYIVFIEYYISLERTVFLSFPSLSLVPNDLHQTYIANYIL